MAEFVRSPESMAIAMAVVLGGKAVAEFLRMTSVEVHGSTVKASCEICEIEVCYSDDATRARVRSLESHTCLREVTIAWDGMVSPADVLAVFGPSWTPERGSTRTTPPG